ncbi:MAG: type II toxin-antitoxin system RelE/ParE family toxin [Actinobacteria bacterium]|nr:type II toxin-antitoxin system RelE/ParE family toxin [Actinomycetota bacterium]
MEDYNIEISPAAERDLKKLKERLNNFDNLVSIIDKLSIEPRPYGVRKVKGFDVTFRIRFESYRII